MTDREIQTCTHELCCEPSYFAWPDHCKKHYLSQTNIKGMFNDLRLEQFLDLAIESNEYLELHNASRTKRLENILNQLYIRKITPIRAVKLYNYGLVGETSKGKIQLATYHKSFNCVKKIEGWCTEEPTYPDPRDNEGGYFTNLSWEEMVCKECEGRCSKSYDGCTSDATYQETINGQYFEYCTNCWNKDGTFEIKHCRLCSNTGELVGWWPTMIDSSGTAGDTTDLCRDCYMEQATRDACEVEIKEEHEDRRRVFDKCFCCEEEFNGSELEKILFFERSDLVGLDVMTDKQVFESIVDSTIGDSKYFCFGCLKGEEYYFNILFGDDNFAVNDIITPRDITFYFGQSHKLMIEGDGFRVYKIKDAITDENPLD